MNRIIGNRLKFLRRNKGISQEKAVDYLHVSQSTYAKMEAGEGYSWTNNLNEICKVFDISPEDLVKVAKVLKEENINSILISRKLIEQYEERIKELKEVVEGLRANQKV
nr:helix-turn-helix transcriptional regulator [uncultured Flavobacterium sp.]